MHTHNQQQHIYCTLTSGVRGGQTDREYADLTLPWKIERQFPIEPPLKENHIKADRKRNTLSEEIKAYTRKNNDKAFRKKDP